MAIDDLSPEAVRFLRAFATDDTPTDFSRIEEIRTEAITNFRPAAERAIEPHAISREDTEVAGIACERIYRIRTKAFTGTLVYLFGDGFTISCPYGDFPI